MHSSWGQDWHSKCSHGISVQEHLMESTGRAVLEVDLDSAQIIAGVGGTRITRIHAENVVENVVGFMQKQF